MADILTETGSQEAGFSDFLQLLKPRVMSLVVFTALVGMVVAPAHLPPVTALVAILSIAVGAGASGALNMWWDADIDAVMRRTKGRPVPAGRVQPGEALGFGLVLSVFSVVILWLATNLAAGLLLAFTIFFYVVIYSIVLKRWTPQNIVIGGAAGAFPPMVGWVAATGTFDLPSWLMFGLIFMWTPPHFWSLALFMKEDYSVAGVPMLTVTHGRKVTRAHILAYTLALVPVSVWAAVSPIGGLVSLALAVWLNLWFVKGAYGLWRRDEVVAEADRYRAEKRFFRFSLAYLFVQFAGFLVEVALHDWGVVWSLWGVPL